jgi:hypothetical protein
MRLCHDPMKTSASFDDPNLVSRAGLVPGEPGGVRGELTRRQMSQGAADQGREDLFHHGVITIWRVLTEVDPLALDRAIGPWAAARTGAGHARSARGGRQDCPRRPGPVRRRPRAAPDGLPRSPRLRGPRPDGRGRQEQRDPHVRPAPGPGQRPGGCPGHGRCHARPAGPRQLPARTRRALPPAGRAWCTLLPSFSWVCQTVQAGRCRCSARRAGAPGPGFPRW